MKSELHQIQIPDLDLALPEGKKSWRVSRSARDVITAADDDQLGGKFQFVLFAWLKEDRIAQVDIVDPW